MTGAARMTTPASSRSFHGPSRTTGPLIVASDGSDAAGAALAFARRLATELPVRVVGVPEPTAVTMTVAELPVYAAEIDEARALALREQLERQVAEHFDPPRPPVTVLIGGTVPSIARLADEAGAAFVVTGLRRHGRVERIFLHRETPIGLASSAQTPVLAVPPGEARLPRTVVVGVDIDDAIVHAAHRARPLLARAEKVYLVHVRGDNDVRSVSGLSWTRAHDELVHGTFDRVAATLELPPTVGIERRVLDGHPVDELLDFADYARADLVVTGFRRHGMVDRVTGAHGVAERVLRGARCMVLAVPDARGPRLPFAHAATVAALGDASRWGEELEGFARRNAGRPVRVECSGPAAHVTPLLEGLVLRDLTLDPLAVEVRMWLDPGHASYGRIEHVTPRIEGLELVRRPDGRDVALRVAHATGYSLLTLHD